MRYRAQAKMRTCVHLCVRMLTTPMHVYVRTYIRTYIHRMHVRPGLASSTRHLPFPHFEVLPVSCLTPGARRKVPREGGHAAGPIIWLLGHELFGGHGFVSLLMFGLGCGSGSSGSGLCQPGWRQEFRSRRGDVEDVQSTAQETKEVRCPGLVPAAATVVVEGVVRRCSCSFNSCRSRSRSRSMSRSRSRRRPQRQMSRGPQRQHQ